MPARSACTVKWSRIVDPIEAARRGIAMVHQHFSLVEPLTVWENVALGDTGRLDPARVRRRVGEISEQYGLEIDPDDRIADLTAGLRQRVEIIKCLRRDPEILVFDEPTSVLSPAESAVPVRGTAPSRRRRGQGRRAGQPQAGRGDLGERRDHHHARRQGRRSPAHRGVRPGHARPGDGRSRRCAAARARSVRSARRIAVRRAEVHPRPQGDPVLRVTSASVSGRDGRVLLDGSRPGGARRRDRRCRRRRRQRSTHTRRRAVEPVHSCRRTCRGRWSNRRHRSRRRHGQGGRRRDPRGSSRQWLRARLQRRREHVHRRPRSSLATAA